MSGSTSQCSMPNQCSPVRPQAVCTSSQMNKPPYCRTIAVATIEVAMRRDDEAAGAQDRLRDEGGDLPVVVVRITASMSSAQVTPQSG